MEWLVIVALCGAAFLWFRRGGGASWGTHGPRCNATTRPGRCRRCRARVFYFTCDHGSKVLFDELGGDWPRHRC